MAWRRELRRLDLEPRHQRTWQSRSGNISINYTRTKSTRIAHLHVPLGSLQQGDCVRRILIGDRGVGSQCELLALGKLAGIKASA